jgi:regulator of nucleoside diphosphate kinase
VLPLPAITLTASDYLRLEQLARVAAQQGDMDAMFLLVEIDARRSSRTMLTALNRSLR